MIRTILLAGAAALATGAAQAAPKHPAAAKTAHAAPRAPAAPLTPLQRTFAMARSDADLMAKDRFADPTPPPADMVGQAFHLELSGDEIGTEPTKMYDKGRLVFYTHLQDVPPDRSTPVSKWRHDKEIVIHEVMFDRGSYTGSNAYGATREVSRSHNEKDALVIVSAPDAEPYPGMSDAVKFTTLDSYPFVQTTTGAIAKELVANSRFVIDGVIAPLSNGKLTGCYSDYGEATISSPYEISTRTCWVGVKVRRMAFVNKATGEVLKEWIDTPETQAAREEAKRFKVSISAEDVARWYPERAQRKHISGSATVTCHVSTYGQISDCKTVSETPVGEGFGEAALKTALFWHGPFRTEQIPEQDVTFPVDFKP